jgi:DNA repair protein RadA/Sms
VPSLRVFSGTCGAADVIIDQVLAMSTRPCALIIDSIQTMRCEGVPSSAGSVTMVKEVAARLLQLAKGEQSRCYNSCSGRRMRVQRRDILKPWTGFEVAVFLLGHVTKAGTLAGPRVLEHMVDTVMYLEGDRYAHHVVVTHIS